MTERLKCCPFCGGDVQARKGYRNITYFECYGCGATVSFWDKNKTEADNPVEQWNKRFYEN